MAAGHERWQDSAAAYLLGALPADELEAFEAHLVTCAACREEVDELAPAAQALPASVEPMAPPPELKGRLMAEVHREAALLAAAGPEADRAAPLAAPAPRRRARRRWALGLPRLAPVAAALLLAAGIAVGVGVSQLGGDGARTFTAQVDASRAPDAGVQIEVDDGDATLIAHGLPEPPSGRVYQVWLKRPGRAPEPTSALFTPSRDGTATATVPGSLEGVEQVLVTDEPRGGSRMPTRQPLIAAALS
jgi:anti-sigma-K factor RskA